MKAVNFVIAGNRTRESNLEMGSKNSEYSVISRKSERMRGRSEGTIQSGIAALSIKVSRVKAGMRDRCTRASMSNEI